MLDGLKHNSPNLNGSKHNSPKYNGEAKHDSPDSPKSKKHNESPKILNNESPKILNNESLKKDLLSHNNIVNTLKPQIDFNEEQDVNASKYLLNT
jgi:hypothetical protein